MSELAEENWERYVEGARVESDGVKMPDWRRTFMRSSGLPIKIPAAPEM